MNQNSAVEAESACRRSPLRGAETSTAELRVKNETIAVTKATGIEKPFTTKKRGARVLSGRLED
jgi:hypothetical protein